MRIAASGPLHNLITYLLLWSLALSGMGKLFWKDERVHGVVIDSVDPVSQVNRVALQAKSHKLSPLLHHLRPGDLVLHLDDIFLGNSSDAWTTYLSGSDVSDERRGWCIDQTLFSGRQALCTYFSMILAHS